MGTETVISETVTYRIVIFPQAETDISEALDYLSEKSPQAAQRWYRSIRAAIGSLAEMPARCPVAPEALKLRAELRHLPYGKRPGVYRIVFRILEAQREVHVLAIRHGARKPLTAEEVEPFMELE